MKFLILSVVFLSLSFVSCNEGWKPSGNIVKNDDDTDTIRNLTFVQRALDVNVEKVSINFMTRRKNRRIQTICRGVDGCLQVCEYFDHIKCKQFSVDQVISFWLGKIGSYTEWSQAEKDLNLIATESEVSAFLKNVDQENDVTSALFSLSTSTECPMGEQNIFYSYSPEPSLYVGPPQLDDDSSSADTDADTFGDSGDQDSDNTALPDDSALPDNTALSNNEILSSGNVIIVTALLPVNTDATDGAGDNITGDVTGSGVDSTGADATDAGDVTGSGVDVDVDATDANANANAGDDMLYQEVQENKKIVDGSILTQFNLPLFRGFIKKCFGHETKTFSEMAVEIENHEAFDIGHDVISKACGGNSECIRLAYCAIDSDWVWKKLEKNVKSAGCEYENFVEML